MSVDSDRGTNLVPTKGPNPTYYCPPVVEEILDRMSNGETLMAIVRQHRDGSPREPGNFPSWSCVSKWAGIGSESKPEFVKRFAEARLDQQRYWAEECVEIANTPEIGYEDTEEYSPKDGYRRKRARRDMLGHRALKIETRLKVIARLNPQHWSERLQQLSTPDSAGGDGGGSRLVVEGGLPDNEPPPPQHDEGGKSDDPQPPAAPEEPS